MTFFFHAVGDSQTSRADTFSRNVLAQAQANLRDRHVLNQDKIYIKIRLKAGK